MTDAPYHDDFFDADLSDFSADDARTVRVYLVHRFDLVSDDAINGGRRFVECTASIAGGRLTDGGAVTMLTAKEVEDVFGADGAGLLENLIRESEEMQMGDC